MRRRKTNMAMDKSFLGIRGNTKGPMSKGGFNGDVAPKPGKNDPPKPGPGKKGAPFDANDTGDRTARAGKASPPPTTTKGNKSMGAKADKTTPGAKPSGQKLPVAGNKETWPKRGVR
jgi:hypothetical protein